MWFSLYFGEKKMHFSPIHILQKKKNLRFYNPNTPYRPYFEA